MQDAKNAMVSGLSSALLPVHWDTKQPLNVNDSDMFPGSTEPLQPRDGPTEMAFCLMTYQICKFLISNDTAAGATGFEAAVLDTRLDDDDNTAAAHKASVARFRLLIERLCDDLLEVEQKYVDESAGNVHIAALTIRPMIRSKLKGSLVPAREQPEWGTEIFDNKDNLFKVVIMNNEHSIENYDIMAQTGFLWFAKLHFQLDVFAVMTGYLWRRPTGTLSDRAWKTVEKIYTYHRELSDMSQKQYAAQAQFTLKAWRSREHEFARAGRSIDTPAFITHLQEVAPAPASSESRPLGASSTTPPMPNRQLTELDQYLGSYLDVSALNWDMWGDSRMNDLVANSGQATQLYVPDFLGNMPLGPTM